MHASAAAVFSNREPLQAIAAESWQGNPGAPHDFVARDFPARFH